MAGKIIADQLEHSSVGVVDTKFVVNGSLKSYVNFDQSGPTVSDSLNISSVTDRSTGRASGNFSSSFSDSNHTATSFAKYVTSGTTKWWSCLTNDSSNGGVTSSKQSWCQTYGDQNEEHFWDSNAQHLMFVGDLA